VVIELKTAKFQPEYAGKLNFYVALVDDVLRREHHNETIGILICGTKNDRSVGYSLGRSTSPMAVAAYTYDKLPPAEQQALPTEGHIVAASEWAKLMKNPAKASNGLLSGSFSGSRRTGGSDARLTRVRGISGPGRLRIRQ
jgi:hypothetical protein